MFLFPLSSISLLFSWLIPAEFDWSNGCFYLSLIPPQATLSFTVTNGDHVFGLSGEILTNSANVSDVEMSCEKVNKEKRLLPSSLNLCRVRSRCLEQDIAEPEGLVSWNSYCLRQLENEGFSLCFSGCRAQLTCSLWQCGTNTFWGILTIKPPIEGFLLCEFWVRNCLVICLCVWTNWFIFWTLF